MVVLIGPFADTSTMFDFEGDEIPRQLHQQPYGWLNHLPNCTIISNLGPPFSVDVSDLVSQTAIRRKAMAVLDAIAVTGCADREARAKNGSGNESNELQNNRPLVFLSHGLAGLVVKQAVLLAMDDIKYMNDVQRTCRLVFFGCPQSTLPEAWRQVLWNMTMAFAREPEGNSRDLPNWPMSIDIATVCQVSGAFTAVAGAYDIVSCYEHQQGQDPVVVDAALATISSQFEITRDLKQKFTTLCKLNLIDRFSKLLTRDITSTPFAELSHRMNPRHSNFFRGVIQHAGSLDPYVHYHHEPGTCTWVTSHKSYQTWLHQVGAPVLHLSGATGCGKSTLLSYLAEILPLRSLPTTRDIILVRFTFESGHHARGSVRGFLVSFICQILLRQPSAVASNDSIPDDIILKWSTSALWDLFLSVLINPARTDVICLLDDVDECDSSIDLFLHRITKAIDHWHVDRLPARLGAFKIIATSKACGREPSKATWKLLPCSHLCIKVNGPTEKDTATIIERQMLHLVTLRPSLERFSDMIVEKLTSPGVTILQAVMNLSVLVKLGVGGTHAEIEQRLRFFPMSTENCYQAVLDSIAKSLRAVATRVLSWILHAARPMRVDELSIALAIDTCEDMPFDRSNIRRDVVETIVPILCPILTIHREHLIFCHPTAKQYIQDETRRKNDQWALEHFTHDTATRCCLAYLNYAVLQSAHSLPEVVHDLPGGRALGLATGEISFHDYATANWIVHYRSTEGSRQVRSEVIRYLCANYAKSTSSTTPKLRTPHMPIDDKANQPHFLQLCELGLVEILNEYADFICNEGNDLLAGLHIAADHGHVAVIRWILESGISSEGAFDELLRAAEKSFLGEVFQVLLEYVLRRCSHMINDSIYGVLLNAICEQGQGEAARILLSVKPLRKSFIRSQNRLPYMESSKPLRLAGSDR